MSARCCCRLDGRNKASPRPLSGSLVGWRLSLPVHVFCLPSTAVLFYHSVAACRISHLASQIPSVSVDQREVGAGLHHIGLRSCKGQARRPAAGWPHISGTDNFRCQHGGPLRSSGFRPLPSAVFLCRSEVGYLFFQSWTGVTSLCSVDTTGLYIPEHVAVASARRVFTWMRFRSGERYVNCAHIVP